MKLKILSFAMALSFTTMLQATVSVGEALPDFKITNLNGEGAVSNTSLKGKVTLIDFWASWCVPCRTAIPALQGLHGEGINMLSITVDKDPKKAMSFVKKYNLPYDVYHDTKAELAKQFGLPAMPSSYLVDQSGKVIKVYAGFKKADEPTIRADIKKAMEPSKKRETNESKKVTTQ
jgi:peroxiredoxin